MLRSLRGLSLCFLILGVYAAAAAAAGPGDEPSLLTLAEASPAPAVSPVAPLPPAQVPNPRTAATLALAPGVVLHGSGHFYAGRPLTGAALVAVELGSLYMMYRGGTGISDAVASGVTDENSPNFGNTAELSNSIGLAVGGLALFLASWFYDLSGAPVAAAETAAARRGEIPRTSELTPQVRAEYVGLVWKQRF
jgi:hypothetical protein